MDFENKNNNNNQQVDAQHTAQQQGQPSQTTQTEQSYQTPYGAQDMRSPFENQQAQQTPAYHTYQEWMAQEDKREAKRAKREARRAKWKGKGRKPLIVAGNRTGYN